MENYKVQYLFEKSTVRFILIHLLLEPMERLPLALIIHLPRKARKGTIFTAEDTDNTEERQIHFHHEVHEAKPRERRSPDRLYILTGMHRIYKIRYEA